MNCWSGVSIALACAAGAGLLAQETASPEFEAASLRAASALDRPLTRRPGTASPGQFTCAATPLRLLIEQAWDLRSFELEGPSSPTVRDSVFPRRSLAIRAAPISGACFNGFWRIGSLWLNTAKPASSRRTIWWWGRAAPSACAIRRRGCRRGRPGAQTARRIQARTAIRSFRLGGRENGRRSHPAAHCASCRECRPRTRWQARSGRPGLALFGCGRPRRRLR